MTKKSREIFIFAVLGIFLLLLVPRISFAQMGDGQRLQEMLSMTDDIISRANEIVANCQNLRGTELLNAAKSLQNLAQQQANTGNSGVSLQLTRQARNKALEAIKACQQAEENEGIVIQQLERTDQLLERIAEAMREFDDRNFTSVFNTAKDNQRQAWEFYRNRQYLPALKLSRQAEKTMQKLAEKLRSGTNDENRIQHQFRQFEANRERIRENLSGCSDEQAFNLARQAQEAYNNAVDFASNGENERAESSLRLAQKFIQEAGELCAQSGSLFRMLEHLKNEAELVADDIRASGNERAVELYREALGYLDKAEQPCQENQTEICAANVRAAQLSLQKAKRLAGI